MKIMVLPRVRLCPELEEVLMAKEMTEFLENFNKTPEEINKSYRKRQFTRMTAENGWKLIEIF